MTVYLNEFRTKRQRYNSETKENEDTGEPDQVDYGVLIEGYIDQDRCGIENFRLRWTDEHRGFVYADKLWETYDDEKICAALGIKEKQLFEARIKVKAHKYHPDYRGIPVENIGGPENEFDDFQSTWFYLEGDKNSFEILIKREILRLASEVDSVSGDDDYYDYFPNAFWAFTELAEKFELQDRDWFRESVRHVIEVYKGHSCYEDQFKELHEALFGQ